MKNILLTIILGMSAGTLLHAQNPKEMVLKVEMKTEQGKDTVCEFANINQGTFSFVGGKGTVKHIINGESFNNETSEEDNQDLYAFASRVTSADADIIINAAAQYAETGVIFSKNHIGEIKPQEASLLDYTLRDTKYYSDDFGKYQEADYGAYFIKDYVQPVNGIITYPITIKNFQYNTKYYYRPYAKVGDGMYMWGTEKSFASLRTVEAALQNETQLQGNAYYDAASGICLTVEAIKQIVQSINYTNDAITQYQARSIGSLFMQSIPDETKAQLAEKAEEVISCVDGEIKLVKSIPASMLSYATAEFAKPFSFSPDGYVNLDTDAKGSLLYTKACTVKTDTLAEGSGVPFDKYVYTEQITTSSNPSIGINLPRALLPGEYKFSVTFAPDLLNAEGQRPNRVYIYIFEHQADEFSEGKFPITGTRIANPDGSGNYFLPNNATECSTVSFDFTVSDTFAPDMIQIQSQVTSKIVADYDRVIRIAEIKVEKK